MSEVGYCDLKDRSDNSEIKYKWEIFKISYNIKQILWDLIISIDDQKDIYEIKILFKNVCIWFVRWYHNVFYLEIDIFSTINYNFTISYLEDDAFDIRNIDSYLAWKIHIYWLGVYLFSVLLEYVKSNNSYKYIDIMVTEHSEWFFIRLWEILMNKWHVKSIEFISNWDYDDWEIHQLEGWVELQYDKYYINNIFRLYI